MVQYSNFIASEGNSNVTAHGDAIMDFNLGDTPARGTSMRMTETVAGKVFFDRTLTDYSFKVRPNVFDVIPDPGAHS